MPVHVCVRFVLGVCARVRVFVVQRAARARARVHVQRKYPHTQTLRAASAVLKKIRATSAHLPRAHARDKRVAQGMVYPFPWVCTRRVLVCIS